MSESEGKTKEGAAEGAKPKPKLLQARTWVPLVKDYAQIKKEGVLQFKDAPEHPLASSVFVMFYFFSISLF